MIEHEPAWVIILAATIAGVLPAVTAAIVGRILHASQKDMRHQVNSRLDELIKAASALARAEGLAQGRAENRDHKP